MTPKSEVYNIDCMDFMRSLPDKAFNLAIVDPPYFSGPERICGVKQCKYDRLTTT